MLLNCRSSSVASITASCVAVMWLIAACDEGVDGNSSEATVCSTISTSWWNQNFAEQRDRFTVELAATPSSNNMDVVVGLSNGPATAWRSLAAIVRFNPQGFVDARSGSMYTAVQQWPYRAGETYYVRFEVDVRARRYSAWVSHEQGQYGSWNQIADNYAFRTDQATVDRLNNVASFVDPNSTGSLQVCGFHANAGPPGGCMATDGGGGFTSRAVTPAINTMIVDVGARVSAPNIDSVVGIASGPVDAYNDFAAAIRFWTNGHFEARDGDTYRADAAVPYRPGVTYSFKFLVDISNKRYSVMVIDTASGAPAVWLARNYRFRPQQATATRLDHVASIVSSSTGHMDACGALSSGHIALQYLREGNYQVAPLANDGALLSDGATTTRLDATGRVVGTLPTGGAVTSDASGNFYVARNVGTTIVVDAYSPSHALLWSRPLAGDGLVFSAGVAGPYVLVLTGSETGTRLYRFSTNGTAASLAHQGITGVAAIGPTGYVITGPEDGGVAFSSYTPDSFPRWSRFIPGSFIVSAIDIAGDGSVAFGGEHFGDIDFGDGPIYAGGGEDGPRNGYMVALDGAGGLRFSSDVIGSGVSDIATNGSRIVVANQDITQFPWITTQVFDASGTVVRTWAEQGFGLGKHGRTVDVEMTSAGTVLLNLYAAPFYWWDRTSSPFFVAVKP